MEATWKERLMLAVERWAKRTAEERRKARRRAARAARAMTRRRRGWRVRHEDQAYRV